MICESACAQDLVGFSEPNLPFGVVFTFARSRTIRYGNPEAFQMDFVGICDASYCIHCHGLDNSENCGRSPDGGRCAPRSWNPRSHG